MGKTYFVDSENVGDNWISLLDTVAEDDEILIFYTAKSPHMSYKNLIILKNSPKEVSFIECCEGNNALDFQLCTELGYRVNNIGDGEYIIVTNDTGFDAVVKYWKNKQVAVKRIKGNDCLPKKTTLEEVVEELPTTDTEVVQVPEPEPVPGGMDSRAKEILFIVGKDNLQMLHQSLQLLFGAKRGKTYYSAFKTDTAYASFISKHAKMSLTDKQKAYCSMVFELGDSKLEMPKDFPKFVIDNWKKKKNLNSFRAALQSKYGKEKSDKYYALIKAHVKILEKIK